VQLLVCGWSSNLVLIWFIVSEILRCLYLPFWLEIAYSRPFWPIVLTPKRPFLTGKHVVWAIKRENRFSGSTWARSREKRTGQDSQKQSQSGNISPIWGEAPTAPIRTKMCMVDSLPDVIMFAKFQVEIFMGNNFTGGRISHFPIDFCMGLTTVQR